MGFFAGTCLVALVMQRPLDVLNRFEQCPMSGLLQSPALAGALTHALCQADAAPSCQQQDAVHEAQSQDRGQGQTLLLAPHGGW